jgi:hypothetical protein
VPASSYWTNFATGEFEVFDGVDYGRWAVSTGDLAFCQMMLEGGKYRH